MKKKDVFCGPDLGPVKTIQPAARKPTDQLINPAQQLKNRGMEKGPSMQVLMKGGNQQRMIQKKELSSLLLSSNDNASSFDYSPMLGLQTSTLAALQVQGHSKKTSNSQATVEQRLNVQARTLQGSSFNPKEPKNFQQTNGYQTNFQEHTIQVQTDDLSAQNAPLNHSSEDPITESSKKESKQDARKSLKKTTSKNTNTPMIAKKPSYQNSKQRIETVQRDSVEHDTVEDQNDEYVPVFLTDAPQPTFAPKQQVDRGSSNMALIPSVGSVVISEKTSPINSPKQYNSSTRLPSMEIGGGGVTSADADLRRRKGARTQMQYSGSGMSQSVSRLTRAQNSISTVKQRANEDQAVNMLKNRRVMGKDGGLVPQNFDLSASHTSSNRNKLQLLQGLLGSVNPECKMIVEAFSKMVAVNPGEIDLEKVKEMKKFAELQLKPPRQVYQEQARMNPKHQSKMCEIEDLVNPVIPTEQATRRVDDPVNSRAIMILNTEEEEEQERMMSLGAPRQGRRYDSRVRSTKFKDTNLTPVRLPPLNRQTQKEFNNKSIVLHADESSEERQVALGKNDPFYASGSAVSAFKNQQAQKYMMVPWAEDYKSAQQSQASFLPIEENQDDPHLGLRQLVHRRNYSLIFKRAPDPIESMKEAQYKHSHLGEYLGHESRHYRQITEKVKWNDLSDYQRHNAVCAEILSHGGAVKQKNRVTFVSQSQQSVSLHKKNKSNLLNQNKRKRQNKSTKEYIREEKTNTSGERKPAFGFGVDRRSLTQMELQNDLDMKRDSKIIIGMPPTSEEKLSVFSRTDQKEILSNIRCASQTSHPSSILPGQGKNSITSIPVSQEHKRNSRLAPGNEKLTIRQILNDFTADYSVANPSSRGVANSPTATERRRNATQEQGTLYHDEGPVKSSQFGQSEKDSQATNQLLVSKILKGNEKTFVPKKSNSRYDELRVGKGEQVRSVEHSKQSPMQQVNQGKYQKNENEVEFFQNTSGIINVQGIESKQLPSIHTLTEYEQKSSENNKEADMTSDPHIDATKIIKGQMFSNDSLANEVMQKEIENDEEQIQIQNIQLNETRFQNKNQHYFNKQLKNQHFGKKKSYMQNAVAPKKASQPTIQNNQDLSLSKKLEQASINKAQLLKSQFGSEAAKNEDQRATYYKRIQQKSNERNNFTANDAITTGRVKTQILEFDDAAASAFKQKASQPGSEEPQKMMTNIARQNQMQQQLKIAHANIGIAGLALPNQSMSITSSSKAKYTITGGKLKQTQKSQFFDPFQQQQLQRITSAGEQEDVVIQESVHFADANVNTSQDSQLVLPSSNKNLSMVPSTPQVETYRDVAAQEPGLKERIGSSHASRDQISYDENAQTMNINFGNNQSQVERTPHNSDSFYSGVDARLKRQPSSKDIPTIHVPIQQEVITEKQNECNETLSEAIKKEKEH